MVHRRSAKNDDGKAETAVGAHGHRAVLLDRDGTVIEDRYYLSDPDQVVLLPRVGAALRALRELGLRLLVVTNQSAIGRGMFDVKRLEEIHASMQRLLAEEGVVLDGIYVCPHTPDDGCACRKPRPGLMTQVARDVHLDPSQCFVIGDKTCDTEFGRAIGAATLLVKTGYGAQLADQGVESADYIVDDLSAAVPIIRRLLLRRQSSTSRRRHLAAKSWA